MQQFSEGRSAFSLIELLVVMAVLGVLASIILPTAGRARSLAKGTSCLSNLKQWGLATHVYASDNDDFLPPDGAPNGSSTKSGWYIDLPPILQAPIYPELPWRNNPSIKPDPSVWVCPASTNRSNGVNLFYYCLNEHVNNTGSRNRPVRLGSLDHPARTVWLFDNGRRAAVAQQNNTALDTHLGGAQFLFLDGHVARFRTRDYWDFKAARGRTNNPDLIWIP